MRGDISSSCNKLSAGCARYPRPIEFLLRKRLAATSAEHRPCRSRGAYDRPAAPPARGADGWRPAVQALPRHAHAERAHVVAAGFAQRIAEETGPDFLAPLYVEI